MRDYEVVRRLAPFGPYKVGRWALLRDGKPVGYYKTQAEAEEMKQDCLTAERLTEKGK